LWLFFLLVCHFKPYSWDITSYSINTHSTRWQINGNERIPFRFPSLAKPLPVGTCPTYGSCSLYSLSNVILLLRSQTPISYFEILMWLLWFWMIFYFLFDKTELFTITIQFQVMFFLNTNNLDPRSYVSLLPQNK